ncbi:hypothetical protein [Paenibacillus sp. NPDC058071]|uniref:hypothetical protein n=1 Tax=Paenibacillus sp. NPDC058071 TaxID=3346326 RepID=UPI0036D92F8D
MAFKPIDLQISIPRTPELSGMQGQANHRPVDQQMRLADEEAKRTEMMRSKNEHVEQSVGLNVRGDQERQQSPYKRKQSGRKDADENEQPQPSEPEHPYKGRHLDITL